MLEQKELENQQLREEVEHLIGTVQEQKVKLTFEGERIEGLQESLYKAGTKAERQSEAIEGAEQGEAGFAGDDKAEGPADRGEGLRTWSRRWRLMESLKAVTKKLKTVLGQAEQGEGGARQETGPSARAIWPASSETRTSCRSCTTSYGA
jgi:hypothetical protein